MRARVVYEELAHAHALIGEKEPFPLTLPPSPTPTTHMSITSPISNLAKDCGL